MVLTETLEQYMLSAGRKLNKKTWRLNKNRYHRSGTNQRWCIGAGWRFVITHQVASLCCVKWRHGRHLEGVTSDVTICIYLTPSIDAHLLEEEEQHCQISSRSDSKWRSLKLFWRGRSIKNKKKRRVAIRDSSWSTMTLSILWEHTEETEYHKLLATTKLILPS